MTLPDFNALCNLTSATLAAVGFVQIRKKRIAAHRVCMIGAVVASTLFLAGYISYHALHPGMTRFGGPATPRAVYLFVLVTHSALAPVVIPLVVITLFRALKRRFNRHGAIARITLPIWLYVSVTGVLVYVMLYKWYPPSQGSTTAIPDAPQLARTLRSPPRP